MTLHLMKLDLDAMLALLSGDLAGASAAAGATLTRYFLEDSAIWLWRMRVDQIRQDPSAAPWLARAVVEDSKGEVIGHAGYHGPPDENGMVEVGYSVDPRYRRQGYGRKILAELLRRAAEEPGVRTVRASISPDNAGSLAIVTGFNFVQVGEQWDEEDGLELIYELPLAPATVPQP